MFHIHMVSDSTGETLSSLTRSVMSQFDSVEVADHVWSLIRTKGQMGRVIDNIKKNPGIVLYTIIDANLQKNLKNECKKLGIPCMSVLSRFIDQFSKFFGVEPKEIAGRQYDLDEDYFERVEAINFALSHDDGQLTENLQEADIVLVGVSRTSKTPTCVYLSYKGIKSANIPFVLECPLPENLFSLKNTLIVGLVISVERLAQIRKSRLLSLNEKRETDYVDIDKIKKEVIEAKKIFLKNNWPIIDVTRKSVEETSANITKLYNDFINK